MNIVDILWVISDRDRLVDGSRHGIYPFSKYCDHNDRDALYYDDKNPVYDEDGTARYPVVLDYLIDNEHHDIVSQYGTVAYDYSVTVSAVKFEGEDDFEIEMIVKGNEVSSLGRSDIVYLISDGQYYAC